MLPVAAFVVLVAEHAVPAVLVEADAACGGLDGPERAVGRLVRLARFPLARWDSIVAALPPFTATQPAIRHVCGVVLRLVVIDLACRLAAGRWLASSGAAVPIDPSALGSLLRVDWLREALGPSRASARALARATRVPLDHAEGWLGGSVRPNDDELRRIARVFADGDEAALPARSSTLRARYAVVDLVDLATALVGSELVGEMSARLADYTNLVGVYARGRESSAASVEPRMRMLLARGVEGSRRADSLWMSEAVRRVWLHETDPLWRASLQAATGNWVDYLQRALQPYAPAQRRADRAGERPLPARPSGRAATLRRPEEMGGGCTKPLPCTERDRYLGDVKSAEVEQREAAMSEDVPALGASNRILREESERLGFRVTPFFGVDTVLLHEGHGLSFFTRGTQTSVQSSVGRTIALDKAIAKAILRREGLPTARGFLASAEPDLHALAHLEGPYVVKPVDGKQGAGVHVGLRSEAEVRARFAERRGPVIVEEMLTGEEYRVFCVDYEVVAVAKRRPAFVVGDGARCIRALIAEKNAHVWRDEGHVGNLTKIVIDADLTETLSAAGRTVEDVPNEGEEVALRRAANLSLGGEAVDVSDQMTHENRALMGRIARAVDLDVVGIDLVCQSLQRPIDHQPRAGVIEVNASPGLRMHHFPMGGVPRNVGVLVLAHVVRKLGGLRPEAG